MKHFIDWLYATPLSQSIQTAGWIIPAVQMVHIVCLSVLFTSMLMLDLRLIGVSGRRHSLEYCAHRFLPWLWRVLPIMLATGLVMIIAEPNRDLQNLAFYSKMTMLFLACCLTFGFQRSLAQDPAAWERSGPRWRLGQALGLVSLLFWVGIIVSGRLIAYV